MLLLLLLLLLQIEALGRVGLLCQVLGASKTRLLLLPLLAELQQQVGYCDEVLSLFAVQWRAAAAAAAADTAASEEELRESLSCCADALAQLAAAEEKCVRNEVGRHPIAAAAAAAAAAAEAPLRWRSLCMHPTHQLTDKTNSSSSSSRMSSSSSSSMGVLVCMK